MEEAYKNRASVCLAHLLPLIQPWEMLQRWVRLLLPLGSLRLIRCRNPRGLCPKTSLMGARAAAVLWIWGGILRKVLGVDPVASSRFSEATERAHRCRNIRNSGPGLKRVWRCLAGGLGRFLPQGLGQLIPESLLALNFMTDWAIGPKDKGFFLSPLLVHSHQLLLWYYICHEECEQRGIIHLRRLTPLIDSFSKEIFLVEVLGHWP